jgi:hypothetical protein
MKEKEIERAIWRLGAKRAEATSKSEIALQDKHAKINAELELIRKQCRHRKRTCHYAYEMPTYWTCDCCGAEVDRPKDKPRSKQ